MTNSKQTIKNERMQLLQDAVNTIRTEGFKDTKKIGDCKAEFKSDLTDPQKHIPFRTKVYMQQFFTLLDSEGITEDWTILMVKHYLNKQGKSLFEGTNWFRNIDPLEDLIETLVQGLSNISLKKLKGDMGETETTKVNIKNKVGIEPKIPVYKKAHSLYK